MNSDIHPPDKWLSFGFALLGGYGDAAGFVLAKTFTGHITGSLVLAAIALVSQDWRAAFAHCSAFACFLSGIPLSALIARLSDVNQFRPPLITVMLVEVVLFVAAYVAFASRAPGGVEILVVCSSLALGLQNGAFRRTGGISVHTNYLTGMLTGLIAGEVEKFTFQVAPDRATAIDSKSGIVSGIWTLFVFGAAMGAAATFHFRELGILGAALILLVIIARNLVTVLRERTAS